MKKVNKVKIICLLLFAILVMTAFPFPESLAYAEEAPVVMIDGNVQAASDEENVSDGLTAETGDGNVLSETLEPEVQEPVIIENDDAEISEDIDVSVEDTVIPEETEAIVAVTRRAAVTVSEPIEEETVEETPAVLGATRASVSTGFQMETLPDGRRIIVYYLNGAKVYGQKHIGDYWYMFDMDTGAMVTGFFQHTAQTNPVGGPKICYYDANGHLVYGQKHIGDYWYMFDMGSGAMVTGFFQHTAQTNPVGGPKICYYDANGHLVYGQKHIGDYWYMFDMGSGAMITGFYNHTSRTNPVGGAKTCYYDANGHLVYGQKHIGDYWYMFDMGSGAMVTGFYTHTARTNPAGGPKTVYYDSNGHMLYGQQTINGRTYYFNTGSGALLEHIVCIDAGHQSRGHSGKIPRGPGATELTNPGVTVGTSGATKMEYELNLDIALLLQQRLEDAGIGVVMVRTTNNVDITNDQRAIIANESGADISIHLHADGIEGRPDVRGSHCIIIGDDNIYTPSIYSESRRLAQCVIDNYISATGYKGFIKRKGTDDGIVEDNYYPMLNFSEIPTMIFEMGFMTNAEEDRLMCDETFQQTMVTGIYNGIMEYYGLS
ncbi:MAG: N-acetylmuramoyl-L-alanine amidase [Lachnospiraceae bacterium]|nr:N-acetylmuramoyl-L-alanine amidase [Lachnospiraceae bacterium]